MQHHLVILLCIVAAVLRLWLSTTKELSFDEYFTITLGLGIQNIQLHFNIAAAATADAWVHLFQQTKQWTDLINPLVFLEDLNPPVYFLGMAPWMFLTPLESLWLRLPSILISIASIGSMVHLCRQFLSQGMTIFLASILGFSSIHLFYSSLARPYALILMLALLSSEMLLSKKWKTYTVCVLIGLLTHLFFLPILLAHGTYLFLSEENRIATLKRWMIAILLPVAALIIWLTNVFALQVSHHQENAIFTGLPWFKLIWHHSMLSRWIFYCDKPLPHWPEYALDIITSLGIWLIFLIEIYRFQFRKTGAWFQLKSRLFLTLGLCWFALPLCILTVLDMLMQSRLSGTERYLYILSPGLLIMLGAIFSSYIIRIRVLVSSILTLMILMNTIVFIQQRGLPTENYQGLAERIQTQLKADDLIIALTGYPTLPALGHYLPPDTQMASLVDFSANAQDAELITGDRLTHLSQNHQTIWLVAAYSQLASLKPIEEVIKHLERQGYRLTQTVEMNNIRLGAYRLSRSQ